MADATEQSRLSPATKEQVVWLLSSSGEVRVDFGIGQLHGVFSLLAVLGISMASIGAARVGMPRSPAVLLWLLGVVGFLVARWWIRRCPHNSSERAEVERVRGMASRVARATDRVQCEARAVEVARLLSLGEIADRPFEPHVFYAPGAAQAPGEQLLLRGALCALGMVLLVSMAVGWLPPWLPMGAEWWFGYVPLLIGGSSLLVGLMFPTYIRIVPGRIEILEFSWLGRRVKHVDRVSLRNQRVLVDTFVSAVMIGRGPAAITLPFVTVRDRKGFVHAVLMGALSTANPPRLPEDALAG